MKEIPLTQGYVTVIDDEDYELVSKYKWHIIPKKGKLYAERSYWPGPKHITLHRFLLGATSGQMVDHKDGDGLNNCRNNIRICTAIENSRNAKTKKNSSTGYKGVYLNKTYKKPKWRSRITISGKDFIIGDFNSAEEAARAYDKKATEIFGEFAWLNFP